MLCANGNGVISEMKNHSDIKERPCITKFRSRPRALLLATCVLFLWPGLASAQEGSLQFPPDHAHAQDYGADWDCDFGYLKRGGMCVALEVPPNGYLASTGRDWKCERGFRKRDRACSAIQIPSNARLSA